ncbi:hypothetical protein Goshw_007943 [Gossypium schwendimanii]|uniref:Uncharacterized protein n=1 Tax=Gossypium schwendimanii TaxID=34291 RepID=A0A7J9N7B9_GOSSC|nr:hypothetical protein [Gossypium schwendimanii]
MQVNQRGPDNYPAHHQHRRCIGQRCTRDHKRGHRGDLLFTNPHSRMGFKRLHHW